VVVPDPVEGDDVGAGLDGPEDDESEDDEPEDSLEALASDGDDGADSFDPEELPAGAVPLDPARLSVR
jgi:hypothetical protein